MLRDSRIGCKILQIQNQLIRRNKIMSQAPISPDVTSDDKLWAALGYPIALVAIIVLLMEDKKARPYIKFHAVQSLVANVVFFVLSAIITTITVGFGGLCVPVLWLVFLYWGYQAYQGQEIKIPFITDFIHNQGWA
jgi:uncharacterized membrane protein